jgi:hypothetical protein
MREPAKLRREEGRSSVPSQAQRSFDALFHELLSGGDLAAARSLVLAPDAEVNLDEEERAAGHQPWRR